MALSSDRGCLVGADIFRRLVMSSAMMPPSIFSEGPRLFELLVLLPAIAQRCIPASSVIAWLSLREAPSTILHVFVASTLRNFIICFISSTGPILRLRGRQFDLRFHAASTLLLHGLCGLSSLDIGSNWRSDAGVLGRPRKYQLLSIRVITS